MNSGKWPSNGLHSTSCKRHRTTSAAWEYFTTSLTEGTKVSCKLCKATISRGRDVKHLTTSVMHNHIHMHLKHPFVTMSSQAPRARANTQPPATTNNGQCSIQKHHTQTTTTTSKQITETLGEMICQDLLPYSIVENTGDRKLLTVTAPCYRVVKQRWKNPC